MIATHSPATKLCLACAAAVPLHSVVACASSGGMLCCLVIHYAVLCCAVAGSMDSGKSTLVAVLTHGADGRPLLDNGRGSARMAVFRHKHEIESGRTSSISQQVGHRAVGAIGFV